jgi:hypothetical protein
MDSQLGIWSKAISVICLSLCFTAQVIVIPLLYWNIPERVPIALALGREDRQIFLSRALGPYQAIQYLNQHCPPHKKVFTVGSENTRLYLTSPILMETELRDSLVDLSMEQVAARMDNLNIAFLLYFGRPEETQNRVYVSESFLEQYATLEYAANGSSVYRLLVRPGETLPIKNLLANPGFELKTAEGTELGWEVYGEPPRLVKDAALAHTGQTAVIGSSNGSLGIVVPIESGKLYSLGHWSRATKSGQMGRLQINWLDLDRRIIGTSIEVVQAESNWTWHQFSASAPANASFANVYVSVHENSEVFFDDYVFVQGQLWSPR